MPARPDATEPLIWLNGRIVSRSAARIDPADRGFLLGDGVFTTCRWAGGKIEHAVAHTARLRAGAALLDLPLPHDDAALEAAAATLAAAHGWPEAALRITLTAGPGGRGLARPTPLAPTLLITAAPWQPSLPVARLDLAQSLVRPPGQALTRVKTIGAYGAAVLGRLEAARRGLDDMLTLNPAGRLTGALAANLVLRRGGRWLTPPLDDGALPGVVRGALLAAGAIEEASLTPAEGEGAEAMLLTNSLIGLRPVLAYRGRALARARPCDWPF